MHRTALTIALLLTAVGPLPSRAALPPGSHPMFDGDDVHEIRLTFHQTDWWDQLVANFEGQEDPAYLAAEFDWEAVHFDSIGVRFKRQQQLYGLQRCQEVLQAGHRRVR